MTTTQTFLLEIGVEELPSLALQPLANALSRNFQTQLATLNIPYESMQAFVAPRRLAIQIKNLALQQLTQQIERKGPHLKAAFTTDGQPTAACLGFARANQIDVSQLQTLETKDGAWVVYKTEQVGKPVLELLPSMIEEALKSLPIAKPMRWGDSTCAFVRPVHWLLALLGETIVPVTLFQNQADRCTYGHRFHHPEAIALKCADDYEASLKKAYVIADFATRETLIRTQIETIAKTCQGVAKIDAPLLTEVAGIVEWPHALLVSFDAKYLSIPSEALVLAMQHHQKCFPIYHQQNSEQLLPYFVTISNIESSNETAVIAGNQRVMHARLSDAAFFFHTDQQKQLADYLAAQKNVVYQAKLGSLFDKSERLAKVTRELLKLLHTKSGNLPNDSLEQDAYRAGLLAKADLLTTMVGEFPELQGVMGYYYAKPHENLNVAEAIGEHYRPCFAGDELPKSQLGQLLAIADRLDILVGSFGQGFAPTGEKDPFGLKRAALGVMRILIEKKLPFDLPTLLELTFAQYTISLPKNDLAVVFDFMMERLRAWYGEQGIKADLLHAVFAVKPKSPYDFDCRIKAVSIFQSCTESSALASANKRVSHLLAQEGHHLDLLQNINRDLLQEPAERALASEIVALTEKVTTLGLQQRYVELLSALSALQAPVDQFFNTVRVMVDDLALKNNRLLLLLHLRALFLRVADISLLHT